jgi:hypothetical protein
LVGRYTDGWSDPYRQSYDGSAGYAYSSDLTGDGVFRPPRLSRKGAAWRTLYSQTIRSGAGKNFPLPSLSRQVFRFSILVISARQWIVAATCILGARSPESIFWVPANGAFRTWPSQLHTCLLESRQTHFAAALMRLTLVYIYVHVCNILREQGWINALGKYVVIVTRGEAPDFVDMRVMSLCTHHIIANSSFSWWAAYLSRRQKRSGTSETTSREEEEYHDAEKGVVRFSQHGSHALINAAFRALMQ